jgi:hypothetical protein
MLAIIYGYIFYYTKTSQCNDGTTQNAMKWQEKR